MTRLSAQHIAEIEARNPEVFQMSWWRRFRTPLIIAAVVLYCVYAWWFFSISKVFSNANWGIAGSYLADWVTYEARPDIRFQDNKLKIFFPNFGPYPDGFVPSWLQADLKTVTREVTDAAAGGTSALAGKSENSFMQQGGVGTGTQAPQTLEQKSQGGFMVQGAPGTAAPAPVDNKVTVTEELATEARVEMGRAGWVMVRPGEVTATRGSETVVLDVVAGESVTPRGPLPVWAEQDEAGGRVIFRFGFDGRVEVESEEVEVRHRFWGWSNFWFDTNSPFWGKSFTETWRLILGGERLDPDISNASLALDNFLNNAEWQHADVYIKLLQTIVMAFVGTLFASLVGLPLAFIAARNIMPNFFLNQLVKRFFDFLRSVDMLIWALFFTRAFGPGPLAGISAIFVTDTGTLGKLYSEALENIDDKQREGVKSVGAAPSLVQRYGVMPQVLPIFASQALYFWEANTRSATIIGAVGAGGIGLKLWEAMRTNSDWENVAYMVLLILIVVYLFDNISNALRSRLMGTQRT
jgi:phosphonate transport system permease protein